MMGYLLVRAFGTGQQWCGAVASRVTYWRGYSGWVIGYPFELQIWDAAL